MRKTRFIANDRCYHHRKRELEQAERELLLTRTAESFGCSGDDAVELIETVKSVYESTSGMSPFGNGFGRGHGRGRGQSGNGAERERN